MPSLGLGFSHKPPLMQMLSSKRPGHRSKTAATAAAAATIVRAFSGNGRLNPKHVHEVVVRQSVRYRKMFHDGTGLLKEDAEDPTRVPRSHMIEEKAASQEKDLDWVTDGEEDDNVMSKRRRQAELKMDQNMSVDEITVEAAESVQEIRDILLDLEKELPKVEETVSEIKEVKEEEPKVLEQPVKPTTVSNQGPSIEVRDDIQTETEPVVAAGAIEDATSTTVDVTEPEQQSQTKEIEETASPVEQHNILLQEHASPVEETGPAQIGRAHP